MSCVSSTDGIPAGFQDLQNVCDHGNTTTTDVTVNDLNATGAVLARGAAETDGTTTINDFVGGDVSTDDHGATLLTSGFAEFGATSTAGTRECSLRFDVSTNRSYIYLNGAAKYVLRATDIYPNVNNVSDLGISSKQWKDFYMSGDATIGGDVTLDSAAPIVTLGDNTGSPTIRQYHAAGNNSRHEFYANNVLRWAWNVDNTPNVALSRYNAAGGFLDNTYILGATHNWEYPGGATYNSASPTVTVGSGGGAPILIMDQNADEAAEFQVANAGGNIGALLFGTGAPASAPGNTRFYFRFDGAAGTSIYKRTGGAWVAIA